MFNELQKSIYIDNFVSYALVEIY